MLTRNADSGSVSQQGGAWQAVATVGVLSAAPTGTLMVYLQAPIANASAVYVNINAAAAKTAGIEIPRAVGSAAGAAWLELPVSSTTCIYSYAAVSGDDINVMWRA